MKRQKNKKDSNVDETLKVNEEEIESVSDDSSLEENTENTDSIGFPDIDIKRQMGCGG